MNILLIIFLILLILITIFTYLMILYASMSKTEEEKIMEDQEQMEYLKNYKEKKENRNKMEIKRGDLYYAALDETYVGSEQTGVRPVVILQNNIGNEHSPTVIIAPITSKVNSKSIIPTHVYIKGYKDRLKQNSLVLTEQIRAIDKSRLKYYIGALDIGQRGNRRKNRICYEKSNCILWNGSKRISKTYRELGNFKRGIWKIYLNTY